MLFATGIIALLSSSFAVARLADPLGPYVIDKDSMTGESVTPLRDFEASIGWNEIGFYDNIVSFVTCSERPFRGRVYGCLGEKSSQVHVAYSDIFQGAAVFAGGPFYCSQGQLTTAVTTCMNPILDKPNAQALADMTYLDVIGGRVANTSNLADDSVFVFSGALDSVVKPEVVKTTEAYYRIMVDEAQGGKVSTEYSIQGEHCFPTNGSFGEACSQLGSPYIGKCGYDGAGLALGALLAPPRMGGLSNPPVDAIAANFKTFDQTPFGGGSNSIAKMGYVYVPSSCQQGSRCRLHVSFHGCQQTEADIGAAYAQHVGLNEWAESNGIVVVYPYVVKSELFPENPEGCFDWWGYAGPDFAYRSGVQMKLVHDVVDKVTGGLRWES